MENDEPLLSIGELARRTGLRVRTIRFWSDVGVLSPAARAEGGRRLYNAVCADQAELVSTLRELGLGLADVRRVPAAERRQMIDDFLAEVFQGLDPSPAHAQRWAAAWDLPDDPSPEQVDAWVELAGLVSDRDFRRRTRIVTEHGIQLQASGLEDLADWAAQHAVAALLRGCPPGSAEAAEVVNRILQILARGWPSCASRIHPTKYGVGITFPTYSVDVTEFYLHIRRVVIGKKQSFVETVVCHVMRCHNT
jgi:DNA-binding transcriptional MerR regulator